MYFELIDILYELEEPSPQDVRLVHDDSEIEYGSAIEYDEQGIPKGRSLEEIRQRESLLSQFLHQWSAEQQGDRKIHNINLNEDIFIVGKSVAEIIQHSSKRYLSTLAVLQMEEVIANAFPVRRVPVKQGNGKQAEFSHMLLLTYKKEGLGTVKVTVGVRFRKSTDNPGDQPKKIEYGISVLDEGEPLVSPQMEERLQRQKAKRKAPHKK